MLLFFSLLAWIAATVIFLKVSSPTHISSALRSVLALAALLYVICGILAYPQLPGEASLISSIFALYMLVGIFIAHPDLKHKRNLAPEERIQEMRFGFFILTLLALFSLFFSVTKW